jgi:hypothetical protein
MDGIEKNQAALLGIIEHLERRIDDGLSRLADRIDRLYGATPPASTSKEVEMDEVAAMFRAALRGSRPVGEEPEQRPTGSES